MKLFITYIVLMLLSSYTFASSVKELSLVCEKQETIEDIDTIKKLASEGAIPRNCLLLTSNAHIKIESEIKNSKAIKILIIDLNIEGYILKEDVIYDENDKKRFNFF